MDLLEQIDALIEERHLLRHSFYRKWLDGTLPVGALQDYARQYFAFESTFPRFLSAIHSRCDRADVRAALLDNMWDEEHGDANHQELWLRFAEGLGIGRAEVIGADRNTSTQALIETYWRAATELPVAAAVAAVHAYERQIPAVAQAKIDGLRQGYGIEDPRTLGFFEVHALLDVEHAEAERRILSELGPADEETVLEGTRAALEAWWGFLDAVDPKDEATVAA
jgi:pyrroloquinoline-quinone synthase